MTGASDSPSEDSEITTKTHIPFSEFLESVHPSAEKAVSGVWRGASFGNIYKIELIRPDLRLYCQRCDGPRAFRCPDKGTRELKDPGTTTLTFVTYLCGNCHQQTKTFALSITPYAQTNGFGSVYKYGETPTFGVPVPNKVLRLFGDDRANFIKGRQCENQGLGVGAFAYYRRVVENHKNEIIDEVIRVCETVKGSEELMAELRTAKEEISFAKAMEQIKTGLPQGLLINGHNPLLALHNALSVGLHNETDEECLEAAQDIRLVLTDLIERMSLLRREDSDLQNAVHRLLAKKGSA